MLHSAPAPCHPAHCWPSSLGSELLRPPPHHHAVWDEWKVDNKEHQHQKLVHRKSGLAAAGGMTQQQLIELQHKLFEEARAATLSGPLPSLALDPSVLSGIVPAEPAEEAEPAGAAALQQSVNEQQTGQQAAQQAGQQPQQALQQPAAVQPGQQLEQQQQQSTPLAGVSPAAQPAQQASGAAGEAAAGTAGGGGAEDDNLDDVTVGDVDSELV